MSISETVDVLGFSHTTVSMFLVFAPFFANSKVSSSSVGKHAVNEVGQRRRARLWYVEEHL